MAQALILQDVLAGQLPHLPPRSLPERVGVGPAPTMTLP